MTESSGSNRREAVIHGSMWLGLVLAYGTLAVQGLLFLLPRRGKAPTRRVFAGVLDQFPPGSTRTLHDLEGRAILVRRGTDGGVKAYSSVCPHLGCQVIWEEGERRFFCPCHRGMFDENGVATAGPPADAKQRLAEVPLEVEQASGVIYLEVRAPKEDRA